MIRTGSLVVASLLAPLAACFGGGGGQSVSTQELNITDTCPGQPVVVETVAIIGAELRATVGHGGCRPEAVWACWDGAFLESFPVQVHLELRHAPAGDCDAFFSQTTAISLAPLRDAYLAVYQGNDPLTVRVDGHTTTWQP